MSRRIFLFLVPNRCTHHVSTIPSLLRANRTTHALFISSSEKLCLLCLPVRQQAAMDGCREWSVQDGEYRYVGLRRITLKDTSFGMHIPHYFANTVLHSKSDVYAVILYQCSVPLHWGGWAP